MITAFQESFGKENVKILLFEDFTTNQIQFIEDLSDFLEVEISFKEKKSLKKNASTSGLFTHLHRMANVLGEENPKKPERKAYELLRTAIYYLDNMSTKRGWKLPGQVISSSMKKRIDSEFAESNQKLTEILGKEFSLKKYHYI